MKPGVVWSGAVQQCLAGLGIALLGEAWLGEAWLGTAWLGGARPGEVGQGN